MEEYGYMLNNLASRIGKHATPRPLLVNQNDNSAFYLLIGLILVFLVIVSYDS